MNKRKRPLLPGLLAAPVLFALGAALSGPAQAIPLVVEEFNSLYVGVDGTTSTSISGSKTYDFVGVGVRSTEPLLTGNAPFAGNPSGTLDVGVGASLSLNYLPATISLPRPLDNSVVLGNGLNSSGTLNVTGGTVSAPMLFVGQADNSRPSTGTATISAGGTFNATLDSGPAGPLPGFPAVNVGRGLGSTGTLTVTGTGSTLTASAGMMSIGREGSGTLNVLDGGVVTVGNTVFGSTVSSTGSATILVQGAGSRLDAGSNDILVGIATNKSAAATHGTAELNVRDGAMVSGNVFLGAGGTLKGDGTISGNVTNNGGTVSPGNSPGTLHVTGNYAQTGGVMVIEIAGPSVFDMLDVTSSVLLDNVLIRFAFIGGYAPQLGDVFDFIHAPSLTNTNPQYEVTGLMPGFQYGVIATVDGLALAARTAGIAIPEPSALGLLSLALLALAVHRRRLGRR